MRRIGYYSEDDISEVARDYYENELTQDQIAKKHNKTRTDISFMLKAARQLGMVNITVTGPPHRQAAADAKAALKDTFPFLRDVAVIETPRAIVEEEAERTGDPNYAYTQEVARVLYASLDAADGQSPDKDSWQLAIGAGPMVRQVLDRLAVRCMETMKFPTVVPAVGWFMNEGTYNALQNAEYFLAKIREAERRGLGAAKGRTLLPLIAFAVSTNQEKDQLKVMEPVDQALGVLKQIQHFFLHVSSYSSSEHRRLSSVRRHSVEKVTCYISGYVIQDDGEPLPDQDQPFGIGTRHLREMVDNDGADIVLAGRKDWYDNRDALAVRAALRGHLGNRLIIDWELARDINELASNNQLAHAR